MISNIVRGGAQWWQLKENESSFVKMMEEYFQARGHSWYLSLTFKDYHHSVNLTSLNLPPVRIFCHSLSTQKIPVSLVINFCIVSISSWPALFSIWIFHQIKDCCCVKKVLSVFIFLLAAISGHNDFLYYYSTWSSLIWRVLGKQNN